MSLHDKVSLPAASKLEDGCVASPGRWSCSQLGADSEEPGAGDSLDCDVPGLGQHVADITESELGRLLAEVSLAADGDILLVQAPGHKVLLHLDLEKTTDVNLDEDR